MRVPDAARSQVLEASFLFCKVLNQNPGLRIVSRPNHVAHSAARVTILLLGGVREVSMGNDHACLNIVLSCPSHSEVLGFGGLGRADTPLGHNKPIVRPAIPTMKIKGFCAESDAILSA